MILYVILSSNELTNPCILFLFLSLSLPIGITAIWQAENREAAGKTKLLQSQVIKLELGARFPWLLSSPLQSKKPDLEERTRD